MPLSEHEQKMLDEGLKARGASSRRNTGGDCRSRPEPVDPGRRHHER